MLNGTARSAVLLNAIPVAVSRCKYRAEKGSPKIAAVSADDSLNGVKNLNSA